MLDGSGFITTLESDEEENLTLEFPDDLLDAMGWREGDELEIQAFAGRIILSKVAREENF